MSDPNVTRLSAEPIEARPRPRVVETVMPPAPPPVAAAPVIAPEPPSHESIHASYAVAARILSVRALLGLALTGAFALAVLAIIKGGVLPLVGLGVYLALTVIPVAALEIRRR